MGSDAKPDWCEQWGLGGVSMFLDNLRIVQATDEDEKRKQRLLYCNITITETNLGRKERKGKAYVLGIAGYMIRYSRTFQER